MLRFLTAGESHGPALLVTVEGIPAHVQVTTSDIDAALARRRLGTGRGARMAFEVDDVTIVAGVRHGSTLGSPIGIMVKNTEWPKWEQVMSADPVNPDEISAKDRNAPLTRPRPGHADLAGMQKYDFDEARPLLERASARETAARVAMGEVAKQFLKQVFDMDVFSHVVELGTVAVTEPRLVTIADFARIDADPVRCADPQVSEHMVAEVHQAQKSADTLGGVIEVVAENVPPGLGSHVHWDRRLDARLCAAVMGIQAIKGVEIGAGFELARTRGSQAHDEIFAEEGHIRRHTNRSGGTEGGISTGERLWLRAAMKPIATVPRALATIDTATGLPASAHHQRSDVCAVPAAGVVAEAMVAYVLADAALEKFGGDSVAETRRNYLAYLEDLDHRGLR